jgi:hypothetical protein
VSEQFIAAGPTLDAYWRSIILFGHNSASYKFAFGTALLELAQSGSTFLTLADIAPPFAKAVAAHLAHHDRQGTSGRSRFLDACRQFNRGEIPEAELFTRTVELGFANVIDAFHKVNRGEVKKRFFSDERRTRGGIELTPDLLLLREQFQFRNLPSEVEARWRLVETAWELGVSVNMLTVRFDPDIEVLWADATSRRRRDVTSCRHAFNGYQKGKCFYCFRDISVSPTLAVKGDDQADVDHFFPHVAGRRGAALEAHLDGIWNLVLACRDCNRGVNGKSARVPDGSYLERLERRNNYLIDSHHPLRETLVAQTGSTAAGRARFLRQTDAAVVGLLIHRWKASDEREPAF